MTALPSTEDLARLSKAITPGPWRVGPVDDTRVEDADGNEVAQIDGDYNQPETWPLMEANAEAIALLPALIREVIDRREAEAWRPETNILPWVALTIEQMRRFEASSGDLERLGLNGEWIPTDTPLSPGLVYRIKPTPHHGGTTA